MTVTTHKGQYPHVEWIDLKADGVLVECAIMKRDPNGNIYFFPLKFLDSVDKRRLFRIITNRNAAMYELWDLMSNITLGNGVNALEFFHQFVRVITPSGQIINPTTGQVGAAAEGALMRPASDPAVPFQPAAQAEGGVPLDPSEEEIEKAKALLANAGLATRKMPQRNEGKSLGDIKKGNEDFT